jgi:hypothetical protein
MPFSTTKSCTDEGWAEIFENVHSPAITESGLGYDCQRSNIRPGAFIKDILTMLNQADVVLADLTDMNPNVFYELGVRHTLKNRTILVSQSLDDVPSDLRQYGVIIYNTKPRGVVEYKQNINRILGDIRDNPERPDNPVSDFLQLKGNNNTFAIEQSQGQAKIDQSKKFNQSGVVLPPHDLFETFFLKLGENLLNILSGSLENGIYKVRYISWFIILSNISVFVYAIWANKISLMLFAFISLFFIFLIFSSLIRFSSENRRCEKCNKYFAYRTMKKTILGDGEYKGERVYNIKEKAKCRFCGNEQIFSVIETDARAM